MNITFNGLTNPASIITFTGFPNILEVSEASAGSKAQLSLRVEKSGGVNDELTLVVNGYTIKSTAVKDKAHGNRFYLSTTSNSSGYMQTAYSLADCLRSIPSIAVNYNVFISTSAAGSQSPTVIIRAKEDGSLYNLTVTGTMVSSSTVKVTKQNGVTSSSLLSGRDNQIIVDVYEITDAIKPKSTTFANKQFITQLKKTHYGDTTYFDLTPIFSSLASYGTLGKVALYVYSLNDGNPTFLSALAPIFVTTGYSVNQQSPFISSFDPIILAQNVSRGEPKPYYNNNILYIYNPSITLSFYTVANVNSRTLTISYFNSAMTQIKSEEYPVTTASPLTTVTIGLDQDTFQQTHFVTVDVPGMGTVKYDVIKPLRATDENQRIYWTNSMGGTSFFDFTGSRTEQRKTKTKYYQKQSFEFYKTGKNERNLVYDKEITITVTLSSQLLENDGRWQLFDLQNSTNAWTEVNGKLYSVNITDIKITESNVSGIYTCQVQYDYSMGDNY